MDGAIHELVEIARSSKGTPGNRAAGKLVAAQLTPRLANATGALDASEKLIHGAGDSRHVFVPAVSVVLLPPESQLLLRGGTDSLWLGLQVSESSGTKPHATVGVLSFFQPHLHESYGLYMDRLNGRAWQPIVAAGESAEPFMPIRSHDLPVTPALGDVKLPDDRRFLHLPADTVLSMPASVPMEGFPQARWFRIPWPENDAATAASRLQAGMLSNVALLTDRLFARIATPLLRAEGTTLALSPSEDIHGPESLEIVSIEEGAVRYYNQARLRPLDAPSFEVEHIAVDERTIARIYFDADVPAAPVVCLRRWPTSFGLRVDLGDPLEPQADNAMVGSGAVVATLMHLSNAADPPPLTLAALRDFVRHWQRYDLDRWADAGQLRLETPQLHRLGDGFAPVVRLVIPLRPSNSLSPRDRVDACDALDQILHTWDVDGHWIQVTLEGDRS